MRALTRDAGRRARKEWFDSLCAKGFQVRSDHDCARAEIKDPAGRAATIEFPGDTIRITPSSNATLQPNRAFHFRYRLDGKIRELTEPGGLRVALDYDERNRLAAIHRGSFGRFAFIYDAEDNLSGIRYPDSSLVRYDHDAAGRVTRIVDRNQSVREFEYSPFGSPTRIIGPRGESMDYDWDLDGSLRRIRHPNGDEESFVDDETEGYTRVLHNDRVAFQLRVDPDSNTQTYEFPDGSSSRFEYTGDGRLTLATDGQSTVKLSYDSAGNVLSEDVNGRVVNYLRDDVGRLHAIVTPEGERICYGRDAELRLETVNAF